MNNSEYLKKILSSLAEKMPFKWRVQSFSKNKASATCVAYIDARDVMDRLDKVCEYGWERLHQEIKGHVYSGVSIVMPDGSKLTRWDCGVESNTEAEKGESSDSFKRAAVNWGVGRFLYDLEILYVKTNMPKATKDTCPYVVDESNKQVWDITKHCNEAYGKKQPSPKASEAEVIPQMTEEQKNLIIKHASLVEYFDEAQRKALLEFAAGTKTFRVANERIKKNEKIILDKNSQKTTPTNG